MTPSLLVIVCCLRSTSNANTFQQSKMLKGWCLTGEVTEVSEQVTVIAYRHTAVCCHRRSRFADKKFKYQIVESGSYPLLRHLLWRGQREVPGTDHGAQQKRSHLQAEPADQASTGLAFDTTTPRVAQPLRNGQIAPAADGNQPRRDLPDSPWRAAGNP